MTKKVSIVIVVAAVVVIVVLVVVLHLRLLLSHHHVAQELPEPPRACQCETCPRPSHMFIRFSLEKLQELSATAS